MSSHFLIFSVVFFFSCYSKNSIWGRILCFLKRQSKRKSRNLDDSQNPDNSSRFLLEPWSGCPAEPHTSTCSTWAACRACPLLSLLQGAPWSYHITLCSILVPCDMCLVVTSAKVDLLLRFLTKTQQEMLCTSGKHFGKFLCSSRLVCIDYI